MVACVIAALPPATEPPQQRSTRSSAQLDAVEPHCELPTARRSVAQLPGRGVENLTRRTQFAASGASASDGFADGPVEMGCLTGGGDHVPSSSAAADARDVLRLPTFGNRQGACTAACAASTNCGEKLLT